MDRKTFLSSIPLVAGLDRRPKPLPSNGATCNTCRYFQASSTMCRRYPPSAPGKFPLVATSDWCGEYQFGAG
jgi:hypothetical protein